MPRLRSATVYAAAWVPVALVFSFALGVTDTVPVGQALAAGTSSTLPAALLGTQVIALCRRFPWKRGRRSVFALVHGFAAVTFTILWAAAIAGEIRLAGTERDAASFLSDGLAWQLVIGLLTYGVIAGVAYASAAFRRQEEQERAAARAETLLLKAELAALRARLDPHFLFNVLQTIGALIEHQPQDAHTALELLGRLLKRRLDATRDTDEDASLAEELEDVREYCALERLRLGPRLEVVEEIEPATLELTVPRFTLQPLVENAIRHGIAPRAAPGRLALSAMRDGEAWTLSVSDDGVGADLLRVEASTGVGLSVVRERLRLRHGSGSTFAVRTAPGHGFTATLRIPAEMDAGDGTARPSAS
jgi:two-component system, LytTR family, sensor kinase